MFNRTSKTTMAVITAAALCFTAVAPADVTYAKAKSVKVTYSIANGNEWLLEPTTLTVSADLDDKYAEYVGYTDDSEEPTMLDATIAAHIAVCGEDEPGFKATPSEYGGGYMTTVCLVPTSSVGYDINDSQIGDDGVYYGLDTVIKKNDEIRLYFYTDQVLFSDTYVFFDKTSIKGKKGSEQTLNAFYYEFDEDYNAIKTPAAGLKVTYNGKKIGTTDENGNVTFKIKKKGIISAKGSIKDAQIVKPYCIVKKKG